jgi:hypothetical protein
VGYLVEFHGVKEKTEHEAGGGHEAVVGEGRVEFPRALDDRALGAQPGLCKHTRRLAVEALQIDQAAGPAEMKTMVLVLSSDGSLPFPLLDQVRRMVVLAAYRRSQ